MTKLYKQKEIEIVNPPPKNFEEAISRLVDKYTSTINEKIIHEILIKYEIMDCKRRKW